MEEKKLCTRKGLVCIFRKSCTKIPMNNTRFCAPHHMVTIQLCKICRICRICKMIVNAKCKIIPNSAHHTTWSSSKYLPSESLSLLRRSRHSRAMNHLLFQPVLQHKNLSSYLPGKKTSGN